jgi:hypothetical protein
VEMKQWDGEQCSEGVTIKCWLSKYVVNGRWLQCGFCSGVCSMITVETSAVHG